MRLAAIMIAVFAFSLAAGWWLNNWFDVDACLDVGGAWNYDLGFCILK